MEQLHEVFVFCLARLLYGAIIKLDNNNVNFDKKEFFFLVFGNNEDKCVLTRKSFRFGLQSR